VYSYSYMFIILIKNTFYVSEVACLMKYNYLLDIFNIVTYESCLMWNWCSTEHFFVFLFYKGTMIMLTWLLKNSSSTQWVGKSCSQKCCHYHWIYYKYDGRILCQFGTLVIDYVTVPNCCLFSNYFVFSVLFMLSFTSRKFC